MAAAIGTALAAVAAVSSVLIIDHHNTVVTQQRAHRAAVARAKERAAERAEAATRQRVYDDCMGQVGELQTALRTWTRDWTPA